MRRATSSRSVGHVSRPCPACRASAAGVLLTKLPANDAGPLFRLARCSGCSLVFDCDWAEGFDAEFYSYYDASLHRPLDDVYSTLTSDRLAEALHSLSHYVDGRRLLDVGCGVGQLVLVASKAGWSARGIDLSQSAIAACRRSGLDCTVTDLLSDELDGEHFDVITMIEFLEHVSTPIELVQRAEELLLPGGALYLTTPNFDSLGRRVLGARWEVINPGHICYFTPRSLKRLVLQSTGLRLEKMRTKNLSIPTIRRLVGRAGVTRIGGDALEAHVDRPSTDETLALRERVEQSTWLRLTKRLANKVLGLTRAGETIEAVFRKPPGDDRHPGLQAPESHRSARSA